MVRIGFLACGALALSGLVACSSGGGGPTIATGGSSGTSGASGSGNTTSSGGTSTGGAGGGGATSSGGSSGASGASSMCTTDCCPTSASCYSTSAGNGAPGSECLAERDNTGQAHVMMRQTWITAKTPAGNAAPSAVYGILAGRSDLNWAACNLGANAATYGAGGYIELDDFYMQDTMNHTYMAGDYSMVGFATYIGGAITAAPTFCYGTQTYTGDPTTSYQLDITGMGTLATATMGWPSGLAKAAPPMPLKGSSWMVAPSKAKRVMADFDASQAGGKRDDVLSMFDPASSTYVGAGYTGLFFYDPTSGYGHGFGVLGWVTVYNAAGNLTVQVPIREVEKRSFLNDPKVPDCIGELTATKANNPGCASPLTDDTMAAWGGGTCSGTVGSTTEKITPDGTCGSGSGESAYTTNGYFLITELEQIYSQDLNETLCVSYPGTTDPKFITSDNKSCKGSGWDPSKADDAGLPMGDWCAATNSAATATCHDAYHSVSYHTFQGAAIKVGTDGAPTTCPFLAAM